MLEPRWRVRCLQQKHKSVKRGHFSSD